MKSKRTKTTRSAYRQVAHCHLDPKAPASPQNCSKTTRGSNDRRPGEAPTVSFRAFLKHAPKMISEANQAPRRGYSGGFARRGTCTLMRFSFDRGPLRLLSEADVESLLQHTGTTLNRWLRTEVVGLGSAVRSACNRTHMYIFIVQLVRGCMSWHARGHDQEGPLVLPCGSRLICAVQPVVSLDATRSW